MAEPFDWQALAEALRRGGPPTPDDVAIVDGEPIDSNERAMWLIANFVDPDTRSDLDEASRAQITEWRERYLGISISEV